MKGQALAKFHVRFGLRVQLDSDQKKCSPIPPRVAKPAAIHHRVFLIRVTMFGEVGLGHNDLSNLENFSGQVRLVHFVVAQLVIREAENNFFFILASIRSCAMRIAIALHFENVTAAARPVARRRGLP